VRSVGYETEEGESESDDEGSSVEEEDDDLYDDARGGITDRETEPPEYDHAAEVGQNGYLVRAPLRLVQLKRVYC